MEDPDNGQEIVGTPVDSTDLPPESPRSLFSLSSFSRLRQFFRCLLLKPDLATPDEGDGAVSPTKLDYILCFSGIMSNHYIRYIFISFSN